MRNRNEARSKSFEAVYFMEYMEYNIICGWNKAIEQGMIFQEERMEFFSYFAQCQRAWKTQKSGLKDIQVVG